jgi:hypothetical protein
MSTLLSFQANGFPKDKQEQNENFFPLSSCDSKVDVFFCSFRTDCLQHAEEVDTLLFQKKMGCFSLCLIRTAPVCPLGTKCVPHIQCTAHFAATKHDASVMRGCTLTNGDRGLCCMTGRDLAESVNMSEALLGSSFGPTNDLRPLMFEARRQYASLMAKEPRLAAIRVDKGVPEDFHNAVFK